MKKYNLAQEFRTTKKMIDELESSLLKKSPRFLVIKSLEKKGWCLGKFWTTRSIDNSGLFFS